MAAHSSSTPLRPGDESLSSLVSRAARRHAARRLNSFTARVDIGNWQVPMPKSVLEQLVDESFSLVLDSLRGGHHLDVWESRQEGYLYVIFLPVKRLDDHRPALVLDRVEPVAQGRVRSMADLKFFSIQRVAKEHNSLLAKTHELKSSEGHLILRVPLSNGLTPNAMADSERDSFSG